MVHGDDFTALGTDAMLNKCEQALAKCCEIKLRGRTGEDPHDLKEIRVLNKVLRACAEGLRYEADPRHVEMLSRSDPRFQNSRKVTPPGVKWSEDLDFGPEAHEHSFENDNDQLEDSTDINNMICSAATPGAPAERITNVVIDGHAREQWQHLRFTDEPEMFYVVPHSEKYAMHPRDFVVIGPILGTLEEHEKVAMPNIRDLTAGANPFTGKIASIVAGRMDRALSRRDLTQRTKTLRRTLCDGAAWEESTAQLLDRICAISAKKKEPVSTMKQDRLGAKRVKTLERLERQGDKLVGKDATL